MIEPIISWDWPTIDSPQDGSLGSDYGSLRDIEKDWGMNKEGEEGLYYNPY